MKTILFGTGKVFLILSLVIFSSCDNNDENPQDTEAPAIEVEDPAYGEYFEAGKSVHFMAMMTDNQGLATYNVDIHNNFDGHSHGRLAATSEDPSLIKWSFSQSFEIPGSPKNYEAHLHDEVEIPSETMAGPYHFIVQAIDMEGNSTSHQDGSAVELEIFITNNSQPVVDITNLVGDELEIEAGSVFMVEGEVTDPTTGEYEGFHSMEIVLSEEHHEGHDHDHGRVTEDHEPMIDFPIEEGEMENYMTDGKISLNAIFQEINFTLSQEMLNELTAEEIDHLLLMVRVQDEQGNITVEKVDVHIHQD
ncbi:MAG TPA: hypothetical protein DDY13_02145 [Cytophagales bacterium]|jgi:hypothetical protein|nr:hypothetical protein [Cytophagales bacterium]